jgi:hypothetical protein
MRLRMPTQVKVVELRVTTGVLKNLVKISERVYVMMSAKKIPVPGHQMADLNAGLPSVASNA